MSDTVERYRKFCKIVGLHSIFDVHSIYNELKKDYDTFYKTSQLDKDKINTYNESNQLPITKNTIIFITADSNDNGNKIVISTDELDEEGNKIKDIETTRTLSEFDTMLWVNGSIYSLSQKNVKTIFFNEDTNKLDIIYSDDYTQSIDVTDLQVSRKIAVKFPLSISEENSTGDNENAEKFDYIRLFGQDIDDSGRNFVIGMYEDEENISDEDNINKCDGFTYTTIIGKGNIASTNGQIIIGDFNKESDNSKFIVCNGKSNNERENLFTISNEGDVFAMKDFVLSQETSKNTHKLSDIHDVIDADWYKEPLK